MSIVINGSGSISGISAGGLPDGVITADDLASGAITSGALPAGSVLQVVQSDYSTQVATTSSSFTDTGLEASITPTSTSSKILILVNQSISPTSGGSNTYSLVRLLRNGSNRYTDQRYCGVTQYNHSIWSICLLDTPASSSLLTYKTQFASGSALYTIEAQHADLRGSFITLMEIAG